MAATKTMRALRQHKQYEPLVVEEVPVPEAGPGVAVVKILAANVISYMDDIYGGARKYPYPTPLTAGTSAIGRVHALGPDSTSLKEGQLVFIDITFRSRDDPSHIILSAIMEGDTDGSRKLMRYWRDGSYAEYMAVPLESAYALNEERLLKELGYKLTDLCTIPRMLVPWGGLVDINLRAGETVIVAPSTGAFGGAAVHVALAIGARVIAMGRNTDALARLKSSLADLHPADRLLTVPMTGDVGQQLAALNQAAGARPIDAFFDISPAQGWNSSHFKAAILALRHSGRVSLMGGQQQDVAFPLRKVMHWNITVKGKWMFERQDALHMIKMVEAGNMVLGDRAGLGGFKEYSLEQWQEAFAQAKDTAAGAGAVLVPAMK